MAKVAAPAPECPERKLLKLDVEPALAPYRANLAAAQEPRAALLKVLQAAITLLQACYAQELIARTRVSIERLQALAA